MVQYEQMNSMYFSEETEKRFWSKVETLEGSDCLNWHWTQKSGGYGLFHLDGGNRGAHRVAYMLTCGEIAKGKFICHECDNPTCVNPGHLYEGTNQDNQRDAVARGQHRVHNKGVKKSHCINGHEFTPKNTYYRPGAKTWQSCRTCLYAAAKRFQRRKMEERFA